MNVSVIIPTFNRRTHVLRAIDSVLKQSVPVDEIIVVDDGSTDGTSEAVRTAYGSKTKVFRQENAGVSAARNLGIREARGEWIAFLDSDDLWFPRKIERQLQTLSSLGDAVGVCFTDSVYVGDPDRKLSVFQETGFAQDQKIGILEDPATYILTGREPFYTPSLLIRRSLLQETDAFDEALILREDTDVFFRLTFRTRFCYTSEQLVEIDRTPSRDVGLSDLYAKRDDRMFESLKRLYAKWLALPEVIGTELEKPVRERLKETYYNSAESKIRQHKFGAALQEIERLNSMGDSHISIAVNMISRKIAKLHRRLDVSLSR